MAPSAAAGAYRLACITDWRALERVASREAVFICDHLRIARGDRAKDSSESKDIRDNLSEKQWSHSRCYAKGAEGGAGWST